MKTIAWIIAIFIVFVIGVVIADRKLAQKLVAERDLEAEKEFRVFSLFSDACQNYFVASIGPRQVLDWHGRFGPSATSTGYQFTGAADLGDSNLDVTCYFDSEGNVLKIVTKNSYRDPSEVLRDIASGN